VGGGLEVGRWAQASLVGGGASLCRVVLWPWWFLSGDRWGRGAGWRGFGLVAFEGSFWDRVIPKGLTLAK
jgi:hypothetical protein